MPRPLPRALLPLLLAVTYACGEATSPPARPLGTYLLQSVNGEPLPWAQFVYSPVDSSVILGRRLDFRPDSSYTLHMDYRFVSHGVGTVNSFDLTGRVRVRGDSLTFMDDAGFPVPYPGRFEGGAVTVWGSLGEEFLYRK
jgi:hypothetical protein